jgi:hypothetical protein
MTENQSDGTSQFPIFIFTIQTFREIEMIKYRTLILLGLDAGASLQEILSGAQQFLWEESNPTTSFTQNPFLDQQGLGQVMRRI